MGETGIRHMCVYTHTCTCRHYTHTCTCRQCTHTHAHVLGIPCRVSTTETHHTPWCNGKRRCVRVWTRACERASVRACMRACVGACVRACVRALGAKSHFFSLAMTMGHCGSYSTGDTSQSSCDSPPCSFDTRRCCVVTCRARARADAGRAAAAASGRAW